MPASTSKESSDPLSFLRTSPESAMHLEAQCFKKEEVARQESGATAFPAPDIPAEVCDRLNALEGFVGLAVRMDSTAAAGKDNALAAALEAGLEQVVRERSGLWFAWDAGLYGCILPVGQGMTAEAPARRIHALLAEQRAETVSIGISQFPLLDYDRPATLQNACKALDHAAFFGPGSIVVFDAVSLNISGDHYYQAGRLEEALEEYRSALRLDPDDVNVHNSLGVCLAQRQDLDGARGAFNEALRRVPGEAMALYNLGMLDMLEENVQGALTRFQQAYALDTDTFEIPFQIGKLLAGQNDHAAALPFLTAAIELRDTNATVFTLLGQCLTALDQLREAIQAYKKAVKLNPNDAVALSALGTLYDQRGENPEICLTFCRQSVALCPEDGLFRWRLARLYQKQNQMEAALAEFEAAAALGHDATREITEIHEQIATPNDKKQCCA